WPIWSQFFGVQEGGSRPSPGHVDVGQLLGSTVEGVATSGAGQGVLTFTTCNGSSLGILLPGTLLPAEQRRTQRERPARCGRRQPRRSEDGIAFVRELPR